MQERVLITVKTYPTLSKKYGELVCTAGLRDDGSWVRIYPVPFRRLDDYLQYNKWVWVDVDLVRNDADPRPESHRPRNVETMQMLDNMGTGEDWQGRKDIVLGKAQVYDDMAELIRLANEENSLSLAVFKPTKFLGFVVEKTDRGWDADTLGILKNEAQQGNLFAEPESVFADFKVVDKVPYVFSYRFSDVNGKESTLMIEDWEIGALYWNCLRTSGGDEAEAVEKVKARYFTRFVRDCDLHLFLGTTRQYHGWASNPFVITGVFYPPKTDQMSFDLNS